MTVALIAKEEDFTSSFFSALPFSHRLFGRKNIVFSLLIKTGLEIKL